MTTVTGAAPSSFKLVTREFLRDPHPTLAALRERGGPVPIVTNGLRMWLVTRYADARTILGDPTLGKDLVKVKDRIEHCLVRPEHHAKLPRPLRASMFERDGDDHRRLRSLLSHTFTHQRVAEYRPRVERLTDELLDALPTDETVDLVGQFTRPLSATLLSELLGIPEESRAQFPDWENTILTAMTRDEVEHAGREMYRFCQEMVQLKRSQPRDDVFTQLVQAAREGKLSEDELVATFFLLLIGGVEPTSAIANGVLTLLTHPDQLSRVLAEPTLWPACIEELLRFESSFRLLPPRHCPHAVELDEGAIPADELVVVANSAANRDPAVFEDPDVFDVSRASRKHLAFGHGEHRCLGAALGKLEMAVSLSKLFGRFPEARLAVPYDELAWRPATHLRRLESLPVLLGARA